MSATRQFVLALLLFLPVLFFGLPADQCLADGCCQLDTHRCMDAPGPTCPGGHTFFPDSCCSGPPARAPGQCIPATHSVPFGGDDTGFIPPRRGCFLDNPAKCELAVSKAEQKLMVCIQKCHDSRAKGKLVDDTAEDACETANDGKSCLAKYFKDTTKTIGKGGCPACIASTVPAIATLAEAVFDANNGLVYCASPSGGFVDGVTNY